MFQIARHSRVNVNFASVRSLLPKILVFLAILELHAPRSAALGAEVCVTRQELSVRALGLVSKYHVADGSMVKKGQILVEFDSRLLKAGRKEALGATDAARANVDLAKDAAQRLELLKSSDSITQQQVVEAKIRMAQAEAVLRQAQGALERINVQISDTVLRADLAGVGRGLPTILGMAVQPGQSLGRIEADPRTCEKKVD